MAEETNQIADYQAARATNDNEAMTAIADPPEQEHQEQPEHTAEREERLERAEQPGPHKRVQKRIEKITSEKYSWQKRAEEAERKLSEYEKQRPQPSRQEELARQAQAEDSAESEARKQPETRQPETKREPAKTETPEEQRLAQARARHHNFDEVVKNAKNPIPDTITFAASQAENNADLAYFFATQPAECQRLMEANPTLEQARAYVEHLSQRLQSVDTERDLQRQLASNPQLREAVTKFREATSTLEQKHLQYMVDNPQRFVIGSHTTAALLQLENGPVLTAHLIRNPEICERLRGMSPERAIAEIGRLSAELERPRERSESKAPDPIKPIGSGSVLRNIDFSDDMSVEDYGKWRGQGGR